MQEKSSILQRLQGLSHSSKTQILIGVVMVSVLGLGALWIKDAKNNLTGIDNSTLSFKGSVLSATKYITVESHEIKNDKHLIYFRIQNPTQNILNISPAEKITLKIDHQTLTPEKVTDRQQSSFVTKVLSNSTVYGMLVFSQFEGNEGDLQFDEMFFENEPSIFLKESIELDFDKLKPVEELRS